MSALGKLNVSLELDSVQFTSGMSKAEYQARKFAQNTQKSLIQVEKSLRSLEKSSAWTNRFLGAGHIASAASGLGNYADAYTELGNRMRLVNGTAVESARSMQTVFDISMRTNQGVEAAGQVYQRFAQNAQQLGISQSQVASLTDTVSKAVAISGASASAAQAALMQFGQSLASGVFRGEEFNSVMEQTPALAKAIADGLGVTTGELRTMAKDGKLTMDVLIPALEKAKASVDDKFNTRIVTLSQSFQNLKTAMTKWTGEANEGVGATDLLSSAVGGLANNLNGVLNVAALSVGVFGTAKLVQSSLAYGANTLAVHQNNQVKYVAALAEKQKASADLAGVQITKRYLEAQLSVATTEERRAVLRERLAIQSTKITALTNAEAAATANLAVAGKKASLFSSTLSFLGGPIGITTGLLLTGALAAYSWYEKIEQAKREAIEFASGLDTTAEALRNVSQITLEANIAKTKEAIKAQKEEVEKLRKEYEKLYNASQKKVGTWFFGGQTGTYDNSAVAAEYADKAAIANEKWKNASDALTKHTVALDNQLRELGNRSYETSGMLGQYAQYSDAAKSNTNSFISPVTALTGAMADLKAMIGATNQELQAFNPNMLVAYSSEAAKSIAQSERDLKRKTLKGTALAEFNTAEALRSRGVTSGQKGYQEAYDKELAYQLANLPKGTKNTASKKEKSLADWQKDWKEYYDEIKRSNASAMGTIDLNQLRMFNQLSEYEAKGVITAKEAADAKLQIEQRYIEERLALAGQYNQAVAADQRYKKAKTDIEELRKGGLLTQDQADTALSEASWDHWKDTRDKSDLQTAPFDGMKVAIHDFGKSAEDVMGNVSNITQNALGGMSDALTDFVMTGKADFKGFALSVIKNIEKMIIQMLIFKAIEAGGKAMGFDISWMRTGKSGGGLVYAGGGIVGFDAGGYTGHGNRLTPAGIVHKGEYVLTKEATSRIGRDYLDFLNYAGGKGFASGGGVVVPKVPNLNIGGGSPKVFVKVINNGEPAQAEVSTRQNQKGELEITVELMRQIAKSEANAMIQNNFRAGGAFA